MVWPNIVVALGLLVTIDCCMSITPLNLARCRASNSAWPLLTNSSSRRLGSFEIVFVSLTVGLTVYADLSSESESDSTSSRDLMRQDLRFLLFLALAVSAFVLAFAASAIFISLIVLVSRDFMVAHSSES